MKIREIIDKVDDNQLFVPAFQREYVWKRDDAKQLIHSLMNEYPTGTLLTWETSDPPELKGPVAYHPNMGSVKLILDGQQRITTLYMLIRGDLPPYYTQKEITHDTRGLYVNVETKELQYHKKSLMEKDPRWVNVTSVFQNKVRGKHVVRALREIQDVPDTLDDKIDDNFDSISRILDREFPEQCVPGRASIKEAIDIFYIVNASGVNLTDAELALAQISGYWPKARERFKAKLSEMAEHGFVVNLDLVVYALLGIVHRSGSEMRKLHGKDNLEPIQAAWKELDEHILDYVWNLLRTHAYVDHTDEINTRFALIPIIVFAHRMGRKPIDSRTVRKLVKWFYYSQIRRRYISQTPQKLDKDNLVLQEPQRSVSHHWRRKFAPTSSWVGMSAARSLG